MKTLFEKVDFKKNPQFEQIILDLQQQQYSIVESFFSLEEVACLRDSLLQQYEADSFKKAAIGCKTNENVIKSIRGDVILWIDELNPNTAETLFFNRINALVKYLNQTCFLGILQKEFHYAIYPKGTFYKRHLDAFQNDDRRKLSIICYLNSEIWKPEYGGELVLYLNREGKEIPKIIYPFPGRLVIFESRSLEHEVKPVETMRLSITGWLKTR